MEKNQTHHIFIGAHRYFDFNFDLTFAIHYKRTTYNERDGKNGEDKLCVAFTSFKIHIYLYQKDEKKKINK